MHHRESVDWQRGRQHEQLWLQDATVRTRLVTGSFEHNVKKLGKTKATPRALRHWERRLLAKDRTGIRVQRQRPVMWEDVVADALIETLEAELGHPLRKPRRREARPEIAVLAEAFTLVEQLADKPPLKRGKGVRSPGSPWWFASRIEGRQRTQLREWREHILWLLEQRITQ